MISNSSISSTFQDRHSQTLGSEHILLSQRHWRDTGAAALPRLASPPTRHSLAMPRSTHVRALPPYDAAGSPVVLMGVSTNFRRRKYFNRRESRVAK